MKLNAISTPPPSGSAPAPAPGPYDVKIDGQCLSIHLTNCSSADAMFLSKVAALFCDPIYAEAAQNVRDGVAAIQRAPDGRVHIVPCFIPNL